MVFCSVRFTGGFGGSDRGGFSSGGPPAGYGGGGDRGGFGGPPGGAYGRLVSLHIFILILVPSPGKISLFLFPAGTYHPSSAQCCLVSPSEGPVSSILRAQFIPSFVEVAPLEMGCALRLARYGVPSALATIISPACSFVLILT